MTKPPMIRLPDIMTPSPVTIRADASLASAAELMLDRGIGSLPVVDEDGRLVGIITDSDFGAREAGVPFSTFRAPQVLGSWIGKEGVEKAYEAARSRRVEEIMSAPVHTVDEEGTLEDVLLTMLRHDIKHVPVVRDGRPVGMVARHDLLKLLLETLRSGGT